MYSDIPTLGTYCHKEQLFLNKHFCQIFEHFFNMNTYILYNIIALAVFDKSNSFWTIDHILT